jgi:lipopolysaccharide export LptBFGC system permease protein LptF
VLLVLAPALSLTYYQRCMVWEKHLLRSVAQPLAFCILSIACIVILFDVQDNLKDFQKQKVPPVQIMAFYVNLFPQIFVEAASPGLVLASIFALLRFVRFNEMVSLMNAGLSLVTIARPVLTLAAFICLLAMAANYHWAPRAEGQRQVIVKGLKRTSSSGIMHAAVMHFNEKDRRLWFIGTVPYNLREDRMKRLHVHELDEQGLPKRGIYAASALWWPQGLWSFYRGYEVTYEEGVPKKSTSFATSASGLQRLDAWWKETPWDIMVSTLNPNNMGVPELAAYLETPGMVKEQTLRRHYAAELWHRLTYPWQGFMLVVLALGLLCQNSRKGNLSSTGLMLAAFVVNHFLLNNVAISLARSAQIPPMVAAWLPHLAVGVPAILLLWWRAYGRTNPFENATELKAHRWRDRWRILRGRRTRPWRGRRFRASWLNEGSRSL